eukprot:g81437.t1
MRPHQMSKVFPTYDEAEWTIQAYSQSRLSLNERQGLSRRLCLPCGPQRSSPCGNFEARGLYSRSITKHYCSCPHRLELDEDTKLDLEALVIVALNFRDVLLSLPPHGSSMRAPLLALAMSGHKHISTDFLASFANVSQSEVRLARGKKYEHLEKLCRTSAPLSLSRSHTSYEYFGFLNFLRLHCPPPSGFTIFSGESFRLRKSRFWTWVDFKLSYANDALPEIDRQLYNRSALSILDSTPSAAVPTHLTQSKRNHKRGQQELKQAHDYNMLTHDKFKYAECGWRNNR